ncbi:hypothetical protein Emag_005514 [Eimeria magna]
MAFFGVDSNLINCGTPSASQKSESCDMTPYQAVLVSREVRMRGVTAAQQTYAQLQYEYGQAYAAYQQLQADVQEKSVAVEKYLGGLDAATRLVCEKAALARISQVQEGGTDYTHPKYAALTAGLSAERRKVIEQLLVPYYTLSNELGMAENALWVKHSSMTAVQQVHLLWTVELEAADWQLQSMPAEQAKLADRNIAELRHLAQRVAEIRKKRLLKRKKEKTVTRHLGDEKPDPGTLRTSPHARASLAVPDAAPRASSAPPSARSSTTRSTTSKASKTKKRPDFDASDWL